MSVMTIFKIVAYILLGGAALYFNYNYKLNRNVTELIAEAENVYKDTVKAGGQKHQWVVDSLYNLIPVALRPIFTQEMVAGIVDRAFAEIENYAVTQLDRKLNK